MNGHFSSLQITTIRYPVERQTRTDYADKLKIYRFFRPGFTLDTPWGHMNRSGSG
jgi:hypothetical protein